MLEVSKKMEDVKLSAGDSQEKLEKVRAFAVKMNDDDAIEEVNLVEAGEKFRMEAGEKIPAVDSTEKMKRNSLTKFFRFNALKSKASKTDLSKGFVDADEAIKPASKMASLTRMFSKKPKDNEKRDGGDKPEVKTRRTFSMRDMVQSVPWIRAKTSQMNLQKPINVAAQEDDEASPPEVLTESVII